MARKERRAGQLALRRQEKKRQREDRALPVLEVLERRRAEHAEERKKTAAALEEEGHIGWMADVLEGSWAGSGPGSRSGPGSGSRSGSGRRAMVVGVGGGEGMKVLLARGWGVVGLDENVASLRAAQETCGGTLVLRGHAREGGEGAYAVDYEREVRPPQPGEAQAVLVEGDLMDDEPLTGALVAAGPFDAVTCWLLDTHAARLHHAKVRAIGMRNADEYRIGMQRLVYRLADKAMRGGGVLQVVDRVGHGPVGAGLSEAAAQGLLRLRAAMAEGTSLELVSLDTRGSLVSVRSRREPASV
jgi:hypothetical protein